MMQMMVMVTIVKQMKMLSQIDNNEKDDTDQLKPRPGTDYANLHIS